MLKKIFKHLLFASILFGLCFVPTALAQNFGLNEVNTGLGGSLTATDPRVIAGRIISIVLGFLGVLAVILISYAGFLWMSSNGDEEKITTAKKILKNGIIGLLIILASWGIATFIISRLSGAVNGSDGTCYDGEIASCGCGGSMTCSNGVFGFCIGSDCGNDDSGPVNCDASPNPGCQAVDQICNTNKYCDHNDCSCKPKGNLGDSCNSSDDGGVCSPDNNRCSEYLSCNADTCTCYGPPVITEISPSGGFCQENSDKSCTNDDDCLTSCNLDTPNGNAHNFITILGKNFGTYSASSSRVVFAASSTRISGQSPSELNQACLDTWRDDQIVIAVPAGITSGPIEVINKDSLSDTTSNDYGPLIPDFQSNSISRPGLCALNPDRGVLSAAVAYQGINLYSGQAYFGNYQSNVHALNSQFDNPNGLSGTSTIPNIQAGNSGSFIQSSLNGHSEKSNYLRFTKDSELGAGPYISSFFPVSGNIGQYITIRGEGFGGARGSSKVYFTDGQNRVEANYDFPDVCLNSVWQDKQVIVKVPANLPGPDLVINMSIGTTTIDSKKLNPSTFYYDKNLDLKSSLCKIEPGRGPAATPVTVWGEYFGETNREGVLKFNYEKIATGTIQRDGRADRIKTVVPLGAITGPVRVVNNSVWGNELNFFVGECTADADCGTQVCCPSGTYKSGRCASTLADCFIDIPNSVFEWSFNTNFSATSTIINNYSCAGLAKYYGACQTGASCPNVPGACSPYAGGNKQVVADCNFNCSDFPGCGLLGNDCAYDSSLNKCVKDIVIGSCSLPQKYSYSLNGKNYEVDITCNSDKHWEAVFPSSCPPGLTRTTGNRCVNLNSSCDICSPDLSCEKDQASGQGHCVSPQICPSGSTCSKNFINGQDKCTKLDQATCDCCCTIGQDARDCCAPLQCEGTCGSDTGKTTGVTMGRCGGCKSAGNTVEERDAACNCTGHSGQFCDINNSQFPDGVCTDCSNLTGTDCSDHSSSCCLDARKTVDPNDDVCRGGGGELITTDKNSPNFGYCAYYNCESLTSVPAGDPNKCASTTPLKIGNYPSVSACVSDCFESDPCSGITDIAECQQHSRCCFDAKIAGPAKCRLGEAIKPAEKDAAAENNIKNAGGSLKLKIIEESKIEEPKALSEDLDVGYCAYYDCASSTIPNLPLSCASTTPVKTGAYSSVDACVNYCANPPAGPGLSCAGAATSTCASDKCNFQGFGCFSAEGLLGIIAPDCGTCCCQPGAATDACAALNPKLSCLADQGNCSGASRGLCCGCSADSECGSAENIGCGSDTCCQARPGIVGTIPAHLSNKVCRNAVIKVDFDSIMDINTFNDNVLLLEERRDSGPCPNGTFIAQASSLTDILASKNNNWLSRLIGRIKDHWFRLSQRFSPSALADLPDDSRLYCAVPGTSSSESSGGRTSLIFTPETILSPSANYYFVVKGDEGLNSQTGVLSISQIGFNGRGYANDVSLTTYTEAENIKFNNRSYKNAHIIKFTTLSDQGASAGICTIDHVSVSPNSYLFKTTNNDLNENDTSSTNATFDTVADRDKVFSAHAYDLNGQLLRPITGYFWDWNFSVDNPAVVSLSRVSNLSSNQVLVSAQNGLTDAETKISATIDMARFLNGCHSGNCSCLGQTCSNSCCNAYSGGDGFYASSPLYVFVCNNPWPPVATDGSWSPWSDNCDNSLGNCYDYNYKFYYCRDAGANGTVDDLPAIINQAVIRGVSSNFTCSSDRSYCSELGSNCGADKNGDGVLDGFCVWNVLKESYFFRSDIPSAGEILSVNDSRIGGTVKIMWRSESAIADSYKVYYLPAGRGSMLSKEFKANNVCTSSSGVNSCQAVINGLSNNVSYIFKVSVVSTQKTESELSGEKAATPTDQIAPSTPLNLHTNLSTTTVQFTWTGVADATLYRLYHGTVFGQYGQSFDSAKGVMSLSFPRDEFPNDSNYFALTAIDASGNESEKTSAIDIEGNIIFNSISQ